MQVYLSPSPLTMRFLLFYILLITSAHTIQAQWRVTTPFTTPIRDITFTDRYNGYAVFQAAGAGSCINNLSIHKTIDQGESWIRLNSGTTNQIRAVHFIDKLTGWIACASSEIRKTTDGGQTWVQQNFGVGSGYNDIWFIDAQNGFVLGDNGMLRRSVNGGATWQTIASGVTAALRRIYFASPQLGFIACGNGQILRTTNGGANWSAISTAAPVMNDIFFVNTSVGYAVGAFRLYKTTNGGLSWTATGEVATTALTRIFFLNPDTGFIYQDGLGLLKTLDGGVTWTETASNLNPSGDSWNSIYFIDDNIGFIGGSGGKINKTTNGGQSWTNVLSSFNAPLRSVYALTRDTALVGGTARHLYKTDNAGVTFRQIIPSGGSSIHRIRFANQQKGFIGCDNGEILQSNDGGKTWYSTASGVQSGILDFHFLNDSLGYAAAGNGTLLRTENQGLSWDSIATGINQDYVGVWFTSRDTGYLISSTTINRTFDGGVTWTQTVPGNAANILKDIVFTNPNLGYCAGSFGRFLRTTNAGLTWDIANDNILNPNISEMWFANDSTGYFSRSNSQSSTNDSCSSINSQSTACLANNNGMTGISMVEGGLYGYASGADTPVLHQVEQSDVYRTIISGEAYCPGSSIFVGFFAKGFFNAGNQFTAQLSNAFGSFDAPQTIGTYTSPLLVYQSGIITANLPAGLPAGNYRIRVVSSNPSIVGPDNGFDIIIQNNILPSVALLPSFNTGNCAGLATSLTALPLAGGLSPQFTWFVNDVAQTTNAAQLNLSSLQAGDQVRVNMQSSLSCAVPNNVNSTVYTIEENTNPIIITLGGDTSLCAGSSINIGPLEAFSSYSWSPSTGLNSANAANPTAIINQSITYQVTVVDANGCTGTASRSFEAIPLPQPAVNATNAACAGSTIALLANEGFSTYAWNPQTGLSNANISNPVATLLESISYELIVTDENGCEGNTSIDLTAFPNPVVQLAADSTVCGNSVIPIGIETIFTEYQWSPTDGLDNATIANPTAFLTESISYTLLVTDEQGCTGMSSISFDVIPLPEVAITADTTICPGTCTSIQASGNFSQITWLPEEWIEAPNESQTSICPPESIILEAFVTGPEGCSTTAQGNVFVSDPGNIPSIVFDGNAISTEAEGPYQWFLNDVILEGEVTNSIIPFQSGFYSLEIVNEFGCSIQSQALEVIVTSLISRTNTSNIRIFPNPAQDQVTIMFATPESQLIRITDSSGRVIFEGIPQLEDALLHINTRDWSNGIYFIQLGLRFSRFQVMH